jgi:hypothetical protein
MKNYRHYIYSFLFVVVVIACDDNYESDAADPAIPLTADANIKAPGHGQYSMHAFTGKDVNVKAMLPEGINSLTITKKVNLENDNTFGTNGVLSANAPGPEYQFTYTPVEADIDQLVGFTFTGKNSDGSEISSDLTLIVTLSPRDNLPKRKWLFKSKIWVSQNEAEDIRECEKDNYWYFNADGTITVDYGTDTAAGDCAFDGFNVYDSWELSEDEKTFTIVYHNLFSGAVTTDVYTVNKLTVDNLDLQIDIDLSWIDPNLYTTHERFIYKYVAQRK